MKIIFMSPIHAVGIFFYNRNNESRKFVVLLLENISVNHKKLYLLVAWLKENEFEPSKLNWKVMKI